MFWAIAHTVSIVKPIKHESYSKKLMKSLSGVKQLHLAVPGQLSALKLAEVLLADLASCHCRIFGCSGEDDQVLLAELPLVPDSLSYDRFDQRVDLRVAGPILRADCVPLTYRLQGRHFGMAGRCSMLPKVCGVDLFLPDSYTGRVGDMTSIKFAVPVRPLLKL